MIDYAASDQCRMRLLRVALDDPAATDCGRCDNCTGRTAHRVLDPELVAAAAAHLRSTDFVIEPRRQWPRGFELRRGNIKPELRAEVGRALAFGTDPGWSSTVAAALNAPDAAVSDELFAGVARMLKRWQWEERPTWVCPVPSRSHPLLIGSLAERIAAVGRMELVTHLRRTWDGHPQQRFMENSARQAGNVVDSFVLDGPVPGGPVLLVDDIARSGWTLTAVAEVLRAAGSGPVLPVVLWRRP
jgi:ATP-dependent DNA helicase RecQ